MGPIPQQAAHLVQSAILNFADTKKPKSPGVTWTSSFTGSGVDLIAMVVSDSGLADEEPKWCNAAPLACILIGLQPRGGWQVMQRAVQWGDDASTRAFGVQCQAPVLYAYFACSIRNRIEVWNSSRFWSPMHNVGEAGHWTGTTTFSVKRPTKLLDGSRGGQAFMCELLRPSDDKHYSIEKQSHMQLLSILLVAAGLMDTENQERLMEMMEHDFGLSTRLSSVFKRLLVGICISNFFALGFAISIFVSLWHYNMFHDSLSYAIKAASLLIWWVGASGLLMLGGNPRVKIVDKKIPCHISERLNALTDEIKTSLQQVDPQKENSSIPATAPPQVTIKKMPLNGIANSLTSTSNKSLGVAHLTPIETALVPISFGSLHGSVFTADQGQCVLPLHVLRRICGWDLLIHRPAFWYLGIGWFGLQLLLSIIMQIGGYGTSTVGAEAMSIGFLLVTSLARGSGLSGSEEWMIPKWKRRVGTRSGTRLFGQFKSRN